VAAVTPFVLVQKGINLTAQTGLFTYLNGEYSCLSIW